MYEALRKEVDWEHQHPDGAVLHSAAFDDSGNFNVADIWESEEHMNKFVTDSPVTKKINMPMPDGGNHLIAKTGRKKLTKKEFRKQYITLGAIRTLPLSYYL
jgi:hypothetical protein